ncbi:MAG: hypothetical protein JO360_12280, partial [Acidobacteria bacterium]|nr:hypothetical protein [Acidobacteriota bacterium]
MASPQSAASLIAQADQLYAQREDMARAREAVTQARQAHTLDFNNYDAVWRLAKFEYYVATHASSDGERDKAFRDGIDAGKEAVKLQDG